MNTSDVAFDPATGLAPVIVQDARTQRVLMLGWLSEESLQLSLDTGLVHFWSRSRSEIWRKGATSGNEFRLVKSALDCDGDAVLFTVEPAGPACHRGTTSCFDPSTVTQRPAEKSFTGLDDLWQVIAQRAADRPAGSYTTKLLSGGVDAVGRKITEEATEVLLAARDHAAGKSAARVYEEVADLLYHLLVLLAERDLTPAGVLDVLDTRARRSVREPASGLRSSDPV